MLGDCDTGSTHAQSSGGIYGNIENCAFDVGRSVQVVIFDYYFLTQHRHYPHPTPPTLPTHAHTHTHSTGQPHLTEKPLYSHRCRNISTSLIVMAQSL